jgi:protein-tyrosine phosphatase
MIRRIVFPFLYLAVFASCTKEKPEIRAACELTSTGTYLIKWETFPPIEGTVKIYESSTADSFNLNSFVSEQEINTGYKTVLAMPTLSRSYFKLIFNKEYSTITANRVISMEKIYNFRDLGGYYNQEKKQSQWGKLYRSSSLAMANKYDIEALNQLGIKTMIDFRTEKDSYDFPVKYQAEQIFNFPLRGNNYNAFFDKILSGRMRKGDVIVYSQGVFSFLLENNSDYFIKVFDILLDKDNYPVVFYCSLGKDRSAIMAALILAALDMDTNTIIDDFLLSNELINYHALIENADNFTPEVQETITALFRAHKEALIYAFERIEKDYGSIDNYLEKELNLTNKKRDKLKSLLLYE